MRFLQWPAGIIYIICAVIILFNGAIISSLLLACAAFFALPISRNAMEKSIRKQDIEKGKKPLAEISVGHALLIGIVLIILAFIALPTESSTQDLIEAEQTEEQKAAETRQRKIELQFSAWSGSHKKLERLIKKMMNDPSSYDHDETRYWDRGDHLIVVMSYRGKNAYGATVKNYVEAKVSLEGEIIEILEES